MDVSFSNVLEGARQYFQGLPAGTGSTAGPSYTSTSENNQISQTEQNVQNPSTSSAYWSSQHEIQRPPAREHTPVQRPSSHHSDTSRPPSHHSQLGFSPSHDQSRIQPHNPYQNTYQESSPQQQQQLFQFSRPHSREAPSNVSQQQHYQSHIMQTPAYHQPPSPQHPRVSRQSEQNLTPPSSQSYHQMQVSQNYQNYQQTRSFYPVPSQSKAQSPQSNNSYKVAVSQPYSSTSQENQYYKSIHSYTPQSQNITHFANQPPPQPQQNAHHVVPHSQQNTSNAQQEIKYEQSLLQSQQSSQAFKATHNLPPIASLSSINFHSSRSGRDVQRLNTSRTRTLSSSGTQPVISDPSNPTSANMGVYNQVRTSNSASVVQSVTVMSSSYSAPTTQQIYSSSTASYSSQSRSLPSQSFQYVTTTTQSYNHNIMTTSTDSGYVSSGPCESSGNISQYYQLNKIQQSVPQIPISRNQQSVIATQQNTQPQVNTTHVELTRGENSTSVVKQKRESPLDLSVKTVRTPADSTLDDVDHDTRLKVAGYNPKLQSIPPRNHSAYASSPSSFQRNLNQRSQVTTATAPKVDFSPDFSLSHTDVNSHRIDSRRNAVQTVDKTQLTHKLNYEKVSNQHLSQQFSTTSRYPTASLPSAAHVTSYIHSQASSKRVTESGQHESLPRIDFPGHAHKTPYSTPTHNAQRKRTGDTAPSIFPNKVVKVDNWKQTIDQQIEQRFSTYKQQQEQKHTVQQNKPVFVNGYLQRNNEKPVKDSYGTYQRPEQVSMPPHQMYTNINQYQLQNNHNQTYVPSVAGHQYPGYSAYQQPDQLQQLQQHSQQQHHQQQQHQQHQQQQQQHQQQKQQQQHNLYSHHNQPLSRTNSNPSLHSSGIKSTKSNVGGAANKHVLSLLRNSLEIKGAKEAQRKLEQEQLYKTYEQLHHPRADIQQPSTDVTAPLQPKPGFTGRQNVSPFTPTNLPESNYTTPYKFHLPRAVDSVNFDADSKNNGSGADKQMEESQILLSTHSSTNSDLDGLAAFLAARIRTKAELKQVGPSQVHYNSPFANDNSANSDCINNKNCNNISASNNSQLHHIIENQLKTPIKEEEKILEQTPSSGTTSSSVSPPKLVKEKQMYSPRRRLFSRNEDDQGSHSSKVPPRDKSGLRSSSETSVFDFPDSDSDGEMPILERQSLEDMRRDRRSNSKPASVEVKSEELSRPPSPTDDLFEQACNNFMEELKSGVGKKRGRRKKGMDHEVLAMLEEAVTKEKPLEELKVKTEIDEVENDSEVPSNIEVKQIKTEISDNADTTIEEVKAGLHLNSDICSAQIESVDEIENTRLILKVDVDIKIEESAVKILDLKTAEEGGDILEENCGNADSVHEQKIKKEIEDIPKPLSPQETKIIVDKVSNSATQLTPVKQTEMPLVIRPAKKPAFGDGSDFCPGWEEEVCKYKKSLRMPPSLIQITRPPPSHRLSTSLPDLDPCHSPADNNEFAKNKFSKIKSEPLDSDAESNSSFNLFSNKNNNYDSEGSSSVVSLPNTPKESPSILDKLLERYGGRKRRKHKKKDEGPKIIPKSDFDLLPTPSLEIQTRRGADVKKTEAVIANESALLGFRQKTIKTFKETFMTQAKKIVGVNEHLTTVVLNSRTRKETRVLKQRATIKEVFGEDRPASAPPDTCVNEVKIKEEMEDVDDKSSIVSAKDIFTENHNDSDNISFDTKLALKNRLLNKDRKRASNLLKTLVDKKIKTELKEEPKDGLVDEEAIIGRDPDCKSQTPSIDGYESSNSSRKKSKFRNIRRKCSSGFDYIRKKKRQSKKDIVESDPSIKPKKRNSLPKSNPESVQDIQKEIKSWVLNKGIGETHLHRAARLGFTDITVYCLEKIDCSPSPRDNAGYTPLHEACARGNLEIAKILLAYGANASESAQGGIRPLHEAVENGFIEIVRLLLSYGADPMLATYAGLTPLALASDEATLQLLQNHMADSLGEPKKPFIMYGPASCFDPKETGYNILDDVPQTDPSSEEEEDIEIEVADSLLPNLYTLKGEPPNDRWVLLQDLSNMLKIKSRDALLRQICTLSPSPSCSTSPVNYKSVLRELKMSDFLEQAHCCQFLNAGEKVNTRASKIALVKYTEKVRELLNVEKVLITLR